MEHVATKLKDLPDWRGDAAVYSLSPAMTGGIEHVVVSAVDCPEMRIYETYIFASDADGEVTDYAELEGSEQGILDHAAALRGAGYSIA